MPKDIRSYFSTISPKSTKPDVEKNKKDKKKKMVIISDSESDGEEHKKTKTQSKSKSPKCEKNKSISPTKQNGTGTGKKKEKEVKSHYFESLKPVNPADVFGSGPVKRTGVPVMKNKTPKNAVKKKINIVADDDDDFDAAVMQLDDNNVQLLMENKYKEDETNITESNSKMEVDVGSDKKKIESFEDKTPVPIGEVINSSEKNKKRSPKKESSKNKSTDSAAVCLVLSESSDSENDESNSKSNVKDKSCSPKSNNKGKKSPVSKKIPQKILTDFLSDSDSDEESIKSNSKTKSPQKRKFEISNSPSSSSPKKQKLMRMDVSGQKRKPDTPTITNEFTPEKKQKKQFSSEISSNNSTKNSNFINSVPKEPIISTLWVDKYKPTNLKQLIGQQGDKSNVKKLISWLQNWRKNHNGKTKLSRPSPWAKNDDGSYFKAALLSGPPGIGKTTTAHLVCKELGYDVVEFNASDTRSKKLLQQEVSELLSTTSLAPYFKNLNLNRGGGGEQEVTTNHVLLMDEVDGMAGNEDRGGIQELIQLIKMSRVPVICMCNDRNHPKMRSLVNYCYDLRFSRPRIEQIKGAMMTICFKEGLKISSDQLNDIIRSTNQDIRLVLNHLSVLAARKDNNLPNSEKFVKLGPWDVLRKVFSEEELKKMSFNEKTDLFFHDYSIAPLFVQENYLSVVPHGKFNKLETMKVFAKAAESISTADIVEKRIRSTNTWSLLPVEAVFASVIPGETLKGHMGGQINFPAWLGKNSSKNKMDRLLQELLVHTRLRVSGSKDALNLDYSSHLRQLIVGPLVQDGSDGVQDALNALQSYDLLKEDLENLSELTKWPNIKDPMDKVESKVKAAFTRAYNKSSNLSPYAVSAVIKKGRGGNTAMDTDELYGENTEDDPVLEDENEEDDSIEVDAMIVAKKKTSKKQQEPSTSKQKGSGGGKRGGKGGKK